MSDKPHLPNLREAYVSAERTWRAECDKRGIDIYSEAAEGRWIGVGKRKQPDDLKRLYLARHKALNLYMSGGKYDGG